MKINILLYNIVHFRVIVFEAEACRRCRRDGTCDDANEHRRHSLRASLHDGALSLAWTRSSCCNRLLSLDTRGAVVSNRPSLSGALYPSVWYVRSQREVPCFSLLVLHFWLFTGFLGKKASILRPKIASKTEERIKLTQEVVDGMKTIKTHAWEDDFNNLVNAVRGFVFLSSHDMEKAAYA